MNNVGVAETLRALYLADNDFETLPADIGKLVNLQIVSISSYTHDIMYVDGLRLSALSSFVLLPC